MFLYPSPMLPLSVYNVYNILLWPYKVYILRCPSARRYQYNRYIHENNHEKILFGQEQQTHHKYFLLKQLYKTVQKSIQKRLLLKFNLIIKMLATSSMNNLDFFLSGTLKSSQISAALKRFCQQLKSFEGFITKLFSTENTQIFKNLIIDNLIYSNKWHCIFKTSVKI